MHMHGTVLTGRNNIFTVRTDDSLYLCRIKGKTLALEERSYNPLAPGDRVRLAQADPANGTAVIEQRLDRENAFQRYNRKREALQTLAANVDLVVAVVSAAHPRFRSRFVDRVLVLSEYHEIEALVAITKADLDERCAAHEADRYRALGYHVVTLRTDEPPGYELLRDTLADRRSVFVGQSGVGKSTLLNRIVGSALQDTASISARDRRGRHTTNAALLVRHDAVEIVDTPGVRELDCRHVPSEELDRQFREFRPLLGRCSLTDCRHGGEPGCAIRAAAADGAIDAMRYESYLRLSEEIIDLQEDYS
jgi:ribosome biogenesis GTPase